MKVVIIFRIIYQFQEIHLDGITESTNYKKISCPYEWNQIKTILGFHYV